MDWILFSFPLGAGLLSSITHCTGMCGPLHLGIRGNTSKESQVWFYHLGRITTYVLLGTICGLFGSQMHSSNWPLGRVIFRSLLIIAYVLFAVSFFSRNNVLVHNLLSRIKVPHLRLNGGRLLTAPKIFSGGLIGGLLPCPTTYAVLAWSLSLPHFYWASAGMLLLGLSTLPSFGLISALVRYPLSWNGFKVQLIMGFLFLGLASYNINQIFSGMADVCH